LIRTLLSAYLDICCFGPAEWTDLGKAPENIERSWKWDGTGRNHSWRKADILLRLLKVALSLEITRAAGT